MPTDDISSQRKNPPLQLAELREVVHLIMYQVELQLIYGRSFLAAWAQNI